MGTISAGAHHYLVPLRRHHFRQGHKPTVMIEALCPADENKHRSTRSPAYSSHFFTNTSRIISGPSGKIDLVYRFLSRTKGSEVGIGGILHL